uniref:DUF7869 domain-containing protein n=1 Tax=Chromera velia CCMP2878 TaxID=1169474 RepID=A0A0G4HTI4_9ALVE|eukprot:Cvel_8486.t1-p1 / transcript=Cvel_8486.t1 / gene=Cvel_8486 / organism=Chromera_velia_CCMP2878 / gene_product=hypothetical protein / transcript_product=hypothetical protein / location=Cvel_scaffold469:13961-19751(+) / protein_length=448 / sequence_SO=supercontig / SO=protein_coding / is_pseudo=false
MASRKAKSAWTEADQQSYAMHSRFPKWTQCEHMHCDRCIWWRIRMMDVSLPREEREEAARQLAEHKIFIAAHNRMTASLKRQAQLNPRVAPLFIEIDGKTGKHDFLPNLPQSTHILGEMMRLQVHTVNVVVHGHEPQYMAFTVFNDFAHGSALVAEVLHRVLKKLQETEKRLPPTCIVRADNCWRENKNQMILCRLFSIWRRKGIFQRTFGFFSMKGHTHCPPDMLASQMNMALSAGEPIRSLQDYHDRLRTCVAGTGKLVYVEHVDKIWNIAGTTPEQQVVWTPRTIVNGTGGLTMYHSFKVEMDSKSGDVLLNYKRWPISSCWHLAPIICILGSTPEQALDAELKRMPLCRVKDIPHSAAIIRDLDSLPAKFKKLGMECPFSDSDLQALRRVADGSEARQRIEKLDKAVADGQIDFLADLPVWRFDQQGPPRDVFESDRKRLQETA